MSDSDLKRRIYELLVGASSLRDFQRWFMPAIWQREGRGGLPGRVELLLAEYTVGHRTRADLLACLARAADLHRTFNPAVFYMRTTMFRGVGDA